MPVGGQVRVVLSLEEASGIFGVRPEDFTQRSSRKTGHLSESSPESPR